MAFKNIFNSDYAIVENVHYNGPRKSLTFDLVQYRDNKKTVETGRMHYTVDGNTDTVDIDSVITAPPAGLDGEAYPEDFDFDAIKNFKIYLVGNNPASGSIFAADGPDEELKTGFVYRCDTAPQKNDAGEWPQTPTEEYEQIPNPDYDEDIDEFAADGTPNEGWQPEFINGDQVFTKEKIRYDWGCVAPTDQFKIFKDKSGKYWEINGNVGSGEQLVLEIDAPFLTDDWDTWFSATAMDAKDKNVSSQIYSWLKTKTEYEDAVDI